MRLTDKLFFGSMIPYLIVGLLDIVYKWFPVEYISMAWVLYLFIVYLVLIVPKYGSKSKRS